MIIAISNQTNVKVFLKSIAYPYENLILDFEKNKLTLLYILYMMSIHRFKNFTPNKFPNYCY